MFFFSGTFYIVTIILQAICVIHCVRKGTQTNWIWLIVFLPLIGCLIYFFSEIVTHREIRTVKSGVGEILNPSGSVKKLEANLRFSDTFTNRMMLADAYLAAGDTGKAIPMYEDSLTGAFSENEHAIAQLIVAYYYEKRYTDILKIVPKISSQPQFPRSKAHILYAMSLAYTGENEKAEKEFLGLKARFSNFEARYYYTLFLQMNDRHQEARQVLSAIIEEIPQLSNVEKRYNRNWLNLSKEMLKRYS
ncbi:MAG TPA: PLDc N-terminal domain-containing protein [Chitinophagaceae bacterium]|jgi:hypothetical protein|nr:PLDc N-terminal domain-containing protein [Chitinophagaceae bacterium]